MKTDIDCPPAELRRQYFRRTALFMGVYCALNIGAIFGLADGFRHGAAIAFALVVTATLGGQVWAVFDYFGHCDEFIRGLLAKRLILAGGITFALTAAWGFLEAYAGFPRVSSLCWLPVFGVAWGAVSCLVRSTL